MLDKLFKFPIIIVDGDEEYRKQEKEERERHLFNSVSLDESEYEPVEFIIGEAEVMYYDLVSIMDRWGLSLESKDMARKGRFDHCYVIFAEAGSFYVPLSKTLFKKRLAEFIKNLPGEK